MQCLCGVQWPQYYKCLWSFLYFPSNWGWLFRLSFIFLTVYTNNSLKHNATLISVAIQYQDWQQANSCALTVGWTKQRVMNKAADPWRGGGVAYDTLLRNNLYVLPLRQVKAEHIERTAFPCGPLFSQGPLSEAAFKATWWWIIEQEASFICIFFLLCPVNLKRIMSIVSGVYIVYTTRIHDVLETWQHTACVDV